MPALGRRFVALPHARTSGRLQHHATSLAVNASATTGQAVDVDELAQGSNAPLQASGADGRHVAVSGG